MKKWIVVLLLLVLTIPIVCQAGMPGFVKEGMGTLSGQVVSEDGKPVAGGVVSFFNTEKGIPPLIAKMHRIPDMVGRMKQDGSFNVKLLPGSYYIGALIITDPARGPGPPREGEKFYFARDDKGNLQEFTLGAKEEKNVGQVMGALPNTFPRVQNLVTIEGRIILEDGKPFSGGVVLVKTDMNRPRPDFVSERTGEDGTFQLQLPADTSYYLLGREWAVGRPVPGSYVGTYGSTSAISQGGVLPIGNARPTQPGSGMPDQPGYSQMVEKEQPKALKGKAGEILTGVDIVMFKVPVPGEQREKIQGTLGFGKQIKEGGAVETKQTAPDPIKDK